MYTYCRDQSWQLLELSTSKLWDQWKALSTSKVEEGHYLRQSRISSIANIQYLLLFSDVINCKNDKTALPWVSSMHYRYNHHSGGMTIPSPKYWIKLIYFHTSVPLFHQGNVSTWLTCVVDKNGILNRCDTRNIMRIGASNKLYC